MITVIINVLEADIEKVNNTEAAEGKVETSSMFGRMYLFLLFSGCDCGFPYSLPNQRKRRLRELFGLETNRLMRLYVLYFEVFKMISGWKILFKWLYVNIANGP